MKHKFRILLAICALLTINSQLSTVEAITLNGVEYSIDTLQAFSAGPGSMYYQLRMTRSSGRGRLDCWLLRVDTKNPYVTIEEVLGKDAVIGTERPSAMAVRKTTPTKIFYGGANGDFFATTGDVGRPTGLTVVNREFAYTQAATGHRLGAVDEDMRGLVGNTFKFSGKLLLPDTTLTIKHVNYTRKDNELVLYNQHNGATTLTNAYGVELGVELLPDYEWHTNATLRMKVTAKEDGVGAMAIPAGQAVLSGHGTMADELRGVAIGDTVTLKLALKVDDVTCNLSQSIGADNYCLIVDNGQVVQSGFWNELHPRTAFGHTAERDTLLFLVVDGRGVSDGCTTKVLGEIIHYYGAHRAANWDGGGSSCLYIRPFGEVNRGSDGSERAVCNAMFAVANVPSDDQTIATIAPELPTYTLPRYGLLTPRFLGYNQYGVLVDTDVQGVTLTCEAEVGEPLSDGRFLASGENGGVVTASVGNVATSFRIRLMTSAPIAFQLDSVLLDSTHAYEVMVDAQVGNFKMPLLAAALTWQSLDEAVATVDGQGKIRGVANGRTQVIGTLGDFSDTINVHVQVPEEHVVIWDDFSETSLWTVSATKNFDPQLQAPTNQDETAANLSFTYVIGRSPFVKMDREDAVLYSRPDTIRIPVYVTADVSKVNIGIRPDNDLTTKNVQLFTEGLPANQWVNLDVPVEAVFGSEPAIFPLWFDYLTFYIATSTTTAAHSILLDGIRLIYNAVPQDETQPDSLETVELNKSAKTIILPNGLLLIEKDGQRYSLTGEAL